MTSQRDLVALRFLLFLGHTYAAVLLLTVPLVAMETTLRRVWLCDEGEARQQAPECGGAFGREDDNDTLGDADADADRGQDKRRRLSHAIGYLCCLSVWMVSGLWAVCGGQAPEEPHVAECLRATDSLMACLPSMLPSPLEPFWGGALLIVVLLIFWAMEVSARLCQERHRAGGDNNINNNNNNNRKSSSWPHLVSALVQQTEPWLDGGSEAWLVVEPQPRFVDPKKTSSRWLSPTAASPWTSQQQQKKAQCIHGPMPLRGSPEYTGWEAERGPRSRPGPQEVIAPSLGVMLTMGLVGVLSLCTLPLTLSVNMLLVQAMQTLVEGCVDTCIACWHQHFIYLCPYFVHK